MFSIIRLLDLVSEAFAGSGRTTQQSEFESVSPQVAAPILIERKNELEQAHLIVAAPLAICQRAATATRRACSGTIIGGGTSSRLWQSIREERGLAYSIGAGGNTYTDVGDVHYLCRHVTWPIWIRCSICRSMKLRRASSASRYPEDELQFAKEQAISSVLLSLKSSSARVGALARQEIIHGRRISPDEIIQSVEQRSPATMCSASRPILFYDADAGAGRAREI